MDQNANWSLLISLWQSPTFIPALSLYLLAAFSLSLPCFLLIGSQMKARRLSQSWSNLAKDEKGVALAADLVLVMIPFITILLVFLQTLWLMRETVIVHYAAYNAARSARVHLCPRIPESTLDFALQRLQKSGCTNDERKAEVAARFALISASPAWGIPCARACEIPDQVIRAIAVHTGTSDQQSALLDQARYAFDPQNVQVEVDFDPFNAGLARRHGRPVPVRARLTFRHYVTYGFGPFFGQERADGYYYRESMAEVTLL